MTISDDGVRRAKGKRQIIQCLLKHKAHLEQRDSLGRTCLLRLCGLEPPTSDRDPVWSAIDLLSCGANPNTRDEDGLSPLCSAFRQQHLDICQALVDYGCEGAASALPYSLGI